MAHRLLNVVDRGDLAGQLADCLPESAFGREERGPQLRIGNEPPGKGQSKGVGCGITGTGIRGDRLTKTR